MYILLLQSYFGPRFFVPQIFLPKKYDYFFKLEEDPIDIEKQNINAENNKVFFFLIILIQNYLLIFEDNCPICMLDLSSETIPLENCKKTVLRNTKFNEKSRQIMKTPCNHKFHVGCLIEWMKLKMICPTCRSLLPEL